PTTDPHLATRFEIDDWKGKRANAEAVRRQFGLAVSRGPLFAIVSRLVHQKGIDLSLQAAETIVAGGGQLVVIGQEREWNHDNSLDWHLLEDPLHKGVQSVIRDLNRLYVSTPALYSRDVEHTGFQWLVADDQDNSVIAWARKGAQSGEVAIVVSNFTPVPREGYRIGVPQAGFYREAFNSDAGVYGGSNLGNQGGRHTDDQASHGQKQSLSLTLPPLATMIFLLEG
ncbi:alpha amylase C-terminal domain-containing protein, partial [Methylobacterium organophilum]|nr:alpha amylase C-terminal domain-containing protein [Methylobacterium organophilum]